MGVYVGMDVHRKRSQLALLDHDGTQLLNRNLPNDPAELVPLLGQLQPGTPVAFEAAYGWGWLVDLLGELDVEPHLVHPSRCKAIAAALLETAKVDARARSHLLLADLLPESWLAPSRSVTSAPCSATAPPWCGWRPCGKTASTPSWPTAASASQSACGPRRA